MQIPQSAWPQSIDVSQFNNGGQPIDWPRVLPALQQRGITRVLVRASYGSGYEDPQFAHNWHSLKALGFPVGAYHAAVPGLTPTLDAHAQQQSSFFLAVVNRQGGLQGDDWPILDYENAQGLAAADLSYWAAHWLSCVDAAVKNPANPAIFASYPAFIAQHLTLYAMLARYPLWLGAYPGGQALPTQAPPAVGAWTQYRGWQYSDTGVIPGIQGAVDLSVWDVAAPPPAPDPAAAVAALEAQVATLTAKITAAQKALQ